MSTVSQTSLDLIQKVAMLGKSGTAKNIYRRKSDKKSSWQDWPTDDPADRI